jgi:hypothetical protein
MTLINNNEKLTQEQVDSIEIAVEEVGIKAVHPEKMEAFAAELVERLKNNTEENK